MTGADPAALRYTRLSIATALLVLVLKLVAWRLSDSVGLLSDALETLTNVAGASMAFAMLRLALTPPDAGHDYGHAKAEYFSSGFTGMLIFAAAALIAVEAWPRLLAPQPLPAIGPGVAVAVLASALNLLLARRLIAAGARYRSVSIEADGRHLMADVWTTAGVLAGLALAVVSGWLWLDAAIALLLAAHLLREGYALIRAAAAGLMDPAWPAADRAALDAVLAEFRAQAAPAPVAFHAIRTRCAGPQRHAEFHVLVPGDWTVQRGHDFLEALEAALAARIAGLSVSTHLEPLEDPRAWDAD